MPPYAPVIPAKITVHLGRPQSNAENVTVSFVDYIKNVASSEIYPTWPEMRCVQTSMHKSHSRSTAFIRNIIAAVVTRLTSPTLPLMTKVL